MRERYPDITELGADVVAIGTGNARYAKAFIDEEKIPFRVLLDEDASAAHAASVRTVGWGELLHPRTWRATVDTLRRGHRVHKPGARGNQLGATFVLGPGDRVRYEHQDADSTDHAPVPEVIAALS